MFSVLNYWSRIETMGAYFDFGIVKQREARLIEHRNCTAKSRLRRVSSQQEGKRLKGVLDYRLQNISR